MSERAGRGLCRALGAGELATEVAEPAEDHPERADYFHEINATPAMATRAAATARLRTRVLYRHATNGMIMIGDIDDSVLTVPALAYFSAAT